MRNFSNFISAYVSYTEGQEATEKIHTWVALSIIAGALERKVFLPRGFYTLFPNLYVFIIGPSGIVRKSTSTGIGVDLLRGLENFHIMSERVTAASLIMQLERSAKRYVVDGKDVNQSAVYCYASELNVFLNEVFGSISELLTTFYDCSPHDSSKPWVYENKSEGKIKIFGPCLNILGASTPTWLARAIPATEMEGGFSSRVIFVVETDPPRKFVAWPETDPIKAAMKPKLFEDLRHIYELSGPMKLTPEVKKYGEGWYEAHTRSLLEQKDQRFSGYYGRKFDTALKIAMLLSVSESDSLLIEESHLVRAIELFVHLERSMFEAFGARGKNKHSESLSRVWNHVKTRPYVTHAELLRNFWRDVDHKTLVEIMEDLRRMNAISAGFEGANICYTARNRDMIL